MDAKNEVKKGEEADPMKGEHKVLFREKNPSVVKLL